MATDSSDRTREEGEGRSRWRQMIAQEENEITTRGGKVKACVGRRGWVDGWTEGGVKKEDGMTQKEEKGHWDVCCHGLKVYTAVYFICIDFQVSAKLNVSFINVAKCISDHH